MGGFLHRWLLEQDVLAYERHRLPSVAKCEYSAFGRVHFTNHSSKANIIHLGDDLSELDMEEVDAQSQANPSSLGTGGGTDHDDADIRPRPLYRWEGILGDKLSSSKKQHASIWAKFGVWFGITPLWRSGVPSLGLALDVRLDTATGRYVLLRDGQTTAPYTVTASKFV